MKAESDELEENVGVVWSSVIVKRRRLVRYDGSVLGREVGQVFRAERRLDEDDDSVFRVKDVLEAVYVDEYGAGVLCPSSIEDVSVGRETEIWRSCSIGMKRGSMYRSHLSVVVRYLRSDEGRTRQVAESALHIRLAYYPEPEDGGSTNCRHKYLSYQVMKWHHAFLATMKVVI